MEDTAACVLIFEHHCNCLLRLFASKLDNTDSVKRPCSSFSRLRRFKYFLVYITLHYNKYVCNVLQLDVCTLAGYVYDNI